MSNIIYIKKDETTLQVTKSVETKEETNEYKLAFLKQQEINILKSKNDFCEARDAELTEVREFILQCKNLGIEEAIAAGLEIQIVRE